MLSQPDGNDLQVASVWRVEESAAHLHTDALLAALVPQHPAKGIFDINAGGSAWLGFVLGVEIGESNLSDPQESAFVRGNDLIASYPQNENQLFTCRLSWRVLCDVASATIVDVLIYLQTDLLESFPNVTVTSQIESQESLLIHDLENRGERESQLLSDSLSGTCPGAILSRPGDASWSYLELTHPQDEGSWQYETSSSSESLEIKRRLGGSFMEKGVIRILRVRSAFLPRDNDVQLASECIQAFSLEAPPLTT